MKAGFSLGVAALLSATAFSATQSASASSETVLYNFPSGSAVVGQIQEDGSGNLYGTTAADKGYGTDISSRTPGCVERKEHSCIPRVRWPEPQRRPRPQSSSGRILRNDTIWRLTEPGRDICAFPCGPSLERKHAPPVCRIDGQYPIALLTRDKATGLLYGTTSSGGNVGCGNAFELNPTTQQFTVLYTFRVATTAALRTRNCGKA